MKIYIVRAVVKGNPQIVDVLSVFTSNSSAQGFIRKFMDEQEAESIARGFSPVYDKYFVQDQDLLV